MTEPALRTAVAVDQGRLALHFGHTDAFAVFTGGHTASPRPMYRVRTADPPGSEHPHGIHHRDVADLLADCETIICGGIGHRAAETLEARGIRVVVSAEEGFPDVIYQKFLAGTLPLGSVHRCCHSSS